MARSLLLLALSLGATAMPASSGMSNIKNIVVLVQENLSFDHFAGGLDYDSSIDGPQNPQYCNPANVSSPSEQVCANPNAKNIASDDPNHSIAGGNMQVFGTYHPLVGAESSMDGFISEQRASYPKDDLNRAAEAINYFSPDHIPVFNTMAQNFVLFDRWFAAVPGPTNPNRAYLTSGTSHGHGHNDDDFLNSALPQKSIFEQLSEKEITWKNYENSTQSKPSFLPDAMFYDWTAKNGKDNVLPISHWSAATIYLDQPRVLLLYVNASPSPINMGENFVKSIYEAVRNSPQWNETLFILTWDEHGGFADHVSPPADVPAGDSLTYTETARDGEQYTFHFDRLGIRVPTLLISPWVSKGLVQHKPSEGNEFTHTSILKFVSELWGLDSLSPRVDWSPSFGNLITNKFRSDTPEKLPDAADF
ncbi:hypothetical protein N7516_010869 [Penicillium verrucosum]|uniref:uncharacterized protein n=1 Tax=Penicillium verrucosum TaxID=60171 RepID=UPI002544E4F5|nr:uncharacterized protein N7516_010869 [Penicillium verrucosum]KAJ5920011.1 hypothetical protein N7516_010869 [Penicillium verrucosum]